jgi:hypothetical protein
VRVLCALRGSAVRFCEKQLTAETPKDAEYAERKRFR